MTYIRTLNGTKIDLFRPAENVYDIREIAVALANQCRFNGFVKKFYSVAEHCVRLSHIVPSPYERVALLHDAAEAFIGDMVHPLKMVPALEFFREVDIRLTLAIYDRFDLNPMPEVVRYVSAMDRALCAIEAGHLWYKYYAEDFKYEQWAYECIEDYRIESTMTPGQAERAFVDRFRLLWPHHSYTGVAQ